MGDSSSAYTSRDSNYHAMPDSARMSSAESSNQYARQPLYTEFEDYRNGRTEREPSIEAGQFDILSWHPAYQSCQKYFLDHSQYEPGTQAVAALINICLPFQWPNNPLSGSSNQTARTPSPSTQYNPYARNPIAAHTRASAPQNWVSLVPYIRRLVVTGFDQESILHGFFGDDWRKGVGSLQECERRNYMFAAKSGGWTKCKAQYDMGPHETVPFLMPPQGIIVEEIESAEKMWSRWLAAEDWMIGPRAPDTRDDYGRSEPNRSQH